MASKLVAAKSIADASLHVRLPRHLHAYVWPFVGLYPIWLFVYLFRYDQYFGGEEYTFVTLMTLLTIHALSFLVCQWSVQAKALLTCRKPRDVRGAQIIKIIPVADRGAGALCPIQHLKDEISFEFQRRKYIYDDDKKHFRKVDYPSDHQPPVSYFRNSRGLDSDFQITAAIRKYGANRFHIPVPTFQELFKEHAVAPFFVFQLFCVGLWCLDDYWYYSIFTLFMLVVFESTVVMQRQRTLTEFRTMAAKPTDIYVYRQNRWVSISSDQLLPGDMVSLVRSREESAVPCDLLLMSGSCVVNEAMLSGESTPQQKESIELFADMDVIDDNVQDKSHCVFGGTKILQVTPSPDSVVQTPDGGCLGYVLRTGFGTSQGKLVRTMVFSTERVSANNLESLLFILFLLIFAIIAANYVWVEGTRDGTRKRSKILLDCVLIITSVVPPELPMELSLAVNTSLIALSKFAIFCTEPFRIPMAGKLDVLCFDKTGTLTGEDLVVEGVAGFGFSPSELTKPVDASPDTVLTLATAHALVSLDDGVVGDPMEKATLNSIDWKCEPGDTIVSADKQRKIRILRRYPFSSALKRMSTVSLIHRNDPQRKFFVSAKGAPETLRKMYTRIPEAYDEFYRYWSRRGSRVLALGYKYCGAGEIASEEAVKTLPRDFVENQLVFAGFLVFHCPLKPDSKAAIAALNGSSHRCVMITGDNPLTAVHVAREVEIVTRETLILELRENGSGHKEVEWKSVDEKIRLPMDVQTTRLPSALAQYDLCVTGPALYAAASGLIVDELISRTWVYARVSPDQKEFILLRLKQAGYFTLMCGDGTNDVGALKQAHVGVALLDGSPEDLEKMALKARIERARLMYEKQVEFASRWGAAPPPMPPILAAVDKTKEQKDQKVQKEQKSAGGKGAPTGALSPQKSRPEYRAINTGVISQKLLEELDDEVPAIKFGDASVAAPFTSKLSSVMAICNIVRQGRCTLVATIQMYKILALNSLVSAYALSVLYLEGIKNGDFQSTISGMLLAVCFLCISRAQPRKELSKKRPQSNIFNLYIILGVLGQFAVHLASLIYVQREAKLLDTEHVIDVDGPFKPSLLNTAVYLISLSMQVSTFAINYQGYPFRERITENKTLYYGLLAVAFVAVAGATEFVPEMNAGLQLVKLPPGFSFKLTSAIVLDFAGAYAVEVVCAHFFADNRPKPIAVRA